MIEWEKTHGYMYVCILRLQHIYLLCLFSEKGKGWMHCIHENGRRRRHFEWARGC